MKRILKFIAGHKIAVSTALVVLATAGYFGYQKVKPTANDVQYITQAVEKGMLISSISGSGQVSASNQVDIKPKVSGELVSLNIKNGQTVKQNKLLAQIDARDAARKVNEAKATLENAKLDLEELLAPTDKLTLAQAENAVADAQESLIKLQLTQKNNYEQALADEQTAEDNLAKAYEDGYNNMANTFLDLPDIMTELHTVLYSQEIAESEIAVTQGTNNSVLINAIVENGERDKFEQYVDLADNDYQQAKIVYDKNYADYKNISRYSDKTAIMDILKQTLETTKKVTDAIKSEINMLDYWVDYRTSRGLRIYGKVATYQSNLTAYTSKTNSHLSTLLSSQRTVEDYKESILNVQRDLEEMAQNNPLDLAAMGRSLKEKEQKLIDLKAGASELEIKNKQLAIQQKENSLLGAQQDYANYFIRAPFDGQVAAVNAAKGDEASSATVIVTLITEQKIAEISLNEIDAAKVKIGQKATLTFDTVSDLPITGEVVGVDTIGTVSQGVVSYNVKIAFDVTDERIKPGMSTSVAIILESKPDVLVAPLSAVKSSAQGSYVEILVNGAPQRTTVTTGSSNDTMIEIISGLEQGEKIVTQTISSSSATNSQSAQGGQQGFGGEFRMLR
ncbi:hypothetical protein COU24_02950 [Candidatus Kuenenbacteria bacterium CG10_big_fil_rev_8_21_14_0_10_39_14]|uniref:Uncharacterized protein n=1 Tax=Candidatus Kuenenbacteria bacterium CG10_big_fil_rev_8_21_14_0_10_39_14 TaxID=1974619 RepID=A0A2H0U566_9BACT|nr:MAG: hypothetical protein COU24_02950 [Candidatus Kuenenbacteria bacterium CG10_big_fil_rev_8_21_14_0_10_39_14]